MTVEHHSYGSKHAALRVDAQGSDQIRHPHTGAVIGQKKALVADFGILGDEQIIRDEEGIQIATGASIRGFHWDSRVAQEQNGWTDEETQSVIDSVEYECRRQPELVWRLQALTLAQPWPTFDTQDDKNAVAFAIEGGLVEQALAYARQQKRKKVVSELEAHLAEQADTDAAASELTAV